MIPILYSSITEGTVPNDYGLGALTDCLSCEVNEERNGAYELTLTYAAQGIHANEIQVDRFIKAKPNFTDGPQLFRIYKVGKDINGRFEVNAQHISYDLSGKPISSGTANNVVSACALLQSSAGGFSISTTKSTAGDFAINGPSSVRSWLGGKDGSLLDVYGGGEWYFNNFSCELKTARGQNRGVSIRYGKNLTELSQNVNCSNLYTHVLSYYQPEEAAAIMGTETATGLAGTKRVLILDATNNFQNTPSVQDLDDYSTAYIAGHNLTTPESNFTLNFVQSGNLTDRVDLCDTVSVYFEPLGISALVKCIRVKWDTLKDRYIETEFGEPKGNIVNTISGNNAAIAEANANASEAKNIASTKNRVFISDPIPPYNVGDLWINEGTVYNCVTPRQAGYVTLLGETTTAIYDGDTTDTIIINGESHTAVFGDVATVSTIIDGETVYSNYAWNGSAWISYEGFIEEDWNLATDYIDASALEETINRTTEIITGATGGHVIIHLDEITGQPYEILILADSADIDTATQVWRWNAGGLGYSKNGYAGPYDTAITIDPVTGDGQINAAWITTGSLNALSANITDLSATMFAGKLIVLGGAEDCRLEVHDENNPPNVLCRLDANGLECFGATVGGVTPSVLFDKNGVTGYSDSADKENTAIFWTKEDQFHMKNSVVENELQIGGKIRFVPITTGSNNGIGIVAIV